MLQQLAAQLIPALMIGLIAYLTFYLSNILKNGGAQALLGFKWILEATPALNTFLVFITRATYFATLVLSTFGRTSKHIVISLDILVTFSILMLIIYHTFKQPDNSPFNRLISL